MPVSREYLDYALEQLAGLGRVAARRMFGAVGLYHDGLFFGLIDDDLLYLKVDDSNRADYVARSMEPFRPFRDRPLYSMAYYQVPADVLEDGESLAEWARKSCTVALMTERSRGLRPTTRKTRGGRAIRRRKQSR